MKTLVYVTFTAFVIFGKYTQKERRKSYSTVCYASVQLFIYRMKAIIKTVTLRLKVSFPTVRSGLKNSGNVKINKSLVAYRY